MDIDKVLLLTKLFALAAKDTIPADSKDAATILKNLSSIETFTDRNAYAERNLDHMSSGSSRLIYSLGKGLVLKLAKNEKGIAQNKAEANPKIKSKYVNPTLKADKDGLWKISPKLEKITEKEFEELTDINFKDFGEAISYGVDKDEKKPEHFEEISKSDLYKEMIRLNKEFDILMGDVERISSWGVKDNCPVLLDTGLTSSIFNLYYDSDSDKAKGK